MSLLAEYEFLYLNLQNLFGSKFRCTFVKPFTKLHLGVFSAWVRFSPACVGFFFSYFADRRLPWEGNFEAFVRLPGGCASLMRSGVWSPRASGTSSRDELWGFSPEGMTMDVMRSPNCRSLNAESASDHHTGHGGRRAAGVLPPPTYIYRNT